MADRAAEIAELLRSLGGKSPQIPLEGLEIHFHAPVVIGLGPEAIRILQVLVDSLAKL